MLNVFRFLILYALCFGSYVYAQTVDLKAIEVIRNFNNQLYITAERTGGSAEEWSALERQASEAMGAVLKDAGPEAVALDPKGRSALHLAAAKGYSFLVECCWTTTAFVHRSICRTRRA